MPPDASKPADAGGPTVTENVTVAQDAGGVIDPSVIAFALEMVAMPNLHFHYKEGPATVATLVTALLALTAENARLRERVEAAAAATLRAENNASRWQDEARVAHTDIADTYIPRAEAAESQLSAARQTIGRLTEALRPFAPPEQETMEGLLWGEMDDSCLGSVTISLRDLRRARAVLSDEETKG